MGPGQIAGLSNALLGQTAPTADAKISLPQAVQTDHAPKVEHNPQGGNSPLGASKFIVPLPNSNVAIQLTNPPAGYLTEARISPIVGANPKQYLLETLARDMFVAPREQLDKVYENDRYVFTCNDAGVPISYTNSLCDRVSIDPPIAKTLMTKEDQEATIAEVVKQHPNLLRLNDKDEQGAYVVGDQEVAKIKDTIKTAFGIPKEAKIGLEVFTGEVPNVLQRTTNEPVQFTTTNRVIGMNIAIEGQSIPFLSTATARPKN